MKHIPVLLDFVLEILGEIAGKTIVDCTFGAGGYSRAFLRRGANVIAFDRDSSVIPEAEKLRAEFGAERFRFINVPFSEISSHISRSPAAIVFDFGVSSMQIDDGARGFSFRFDAPLDMRMSASGDSAAELIENSSYDKLAEILREYGDLKKARAIAAAIKKNLPKTTFELKDLVHNPKDIAPVFQALRIAVNDELGEIRRALDDVSGLLGAGGICACVTFNSLEDRLVKHEFRKWTTAAGDPRMPETAAPEFRLLKTRRPDDQELQTNPRARSAHIRAVVKIAG
ncbi:MAG: 16S rRNA (cytosine(1402)-N(4))-methyltransferase RsmH [Rickettsiales bacterium]|jgi:16S rRNA (cytosine1402-N4)-methyltransferase|nr:16S rRNA (cytosine(1402)-N(4))-methyltransferase RsmH [Rickettsiales bacterium]